MTFIRPLRPVATRRPHVEYDPEKQLSSMPSGACTLLALSRGNLLPKSSQTQLPERALDDLSSDAQLEERASKETTLNVRPNPQGRVFRSVEMTAISTGTDCVDNEGHGVLRQNEEVSSSKLSHSLRKEQLQRVLDSLMSQDSSTLLLCGGEEDCCRIIPAHIRDSADSTAQWTEAQRVWNQHNMNWRSWLPWYGVKSVSVVKVKIAGKMPRVKQVPKQPEIFIGVYRPEDTKAEISRLGDINPDFFTDEFECLLDKSDYTWSHDLACPSTAGELELGWTCPYEDNLRARRSLSRLQNRPFLSILFCNPALAEEHESMHQQYLLISHL
ncbi:hypothetical protein J7T55_000428 [Diaporthe amygdali]|uniref:uncharacterized protein n=1 Tax=Phomopsis amygdali TaxID=1214568 RepID=UPI0022FE638A|nr:uncharacterized protein J7T55_000428 [Diaporthe amygdali]KAJ0109502.1 hypothetical protein J7T55_000428 [Diaporthe amygdali]